LLITLIFALVSAQAWAQNDMKLVVEPGIPDSNDLIKISVTNSQCRFPSQILDELHSFQSFQITLFPPSSLVEQQCLKDNPQPPNFNTTIGPLAPGEYSVSLSERGGLGCCGIVDLKSFSVIDAPPTVKLSEGGINGLYYDPDADGHYVYVLETDYTTLVVWTTFDADGNQAWVYGTGELENGSSLIANTYINRNGRVSLDGVIDPAQDEHWGWLRIDMTSCGDGVVSFHSDLPEFGSEDLPEFGSGQFPIERLAFAKQIGCAETE